MFEKNIKIVHKISTLMWIDVILFEKNLLENFKHPASKIFCASIARFLEPYYSHRYRKMSKGQEGASKPAAAQFPHFLSDMSTRHHPVVSRLKT